MASGVLWGAKGSAVLLLLVFLFPVRTSAQAAGSGESVTGFMSLSAGLTWPSSTTFNQAAAVSDGAWPASTTPPLLRNSAGTEYSIRESPTFDVGGGVLLGRGLGIGVAVSRYTDKRPASVTVTSEHPLDHPTLSAQSTSDPLERVEVGVHVQLVYMVPISERFQLMVFGGPSHFSIKQDVVADLDSVETFNRLTRSWSLTVSGLQSERANASGWGGNVGTDATYFVSDAIGIGVLIRYSQAKVSLPNAMLSTVRQRTVTGDVDAGGLHVSGGLRLRF